ncbi:Holliday junction endonuclease [Halomonas sp. N3-2A]|uniref:Holliday junction endonuclease n=1 Tax=Halomonas sp. N3-2A TaxID=2014541 RepID=UPI000B5B1499|nr:Holliday junction endonuclease [Halomonas sp. N3-2A]ASK18406.1 Holliday junction endonuclease [Halomonas sp. N3-2A]
MIIGIDPGLSGAIAVIRPDGDSRASVMPVVGKEIDVKALMAFIHLVEPTMVVIEKLGVRPGQSAQSGVTSGTNYGVLLGVIQALGYPLRITRPQEWKAKVLKGTKKDKDAAINHVRRAYPGVDLTPGKKRVPHDGIADAVCIAEFGRQLMARGDA